jgi:hypothetical protein
MRENNSHCEAVSNFSSSEEEIGKLSNSVAEESVCIRDAGSVGSVERNSILCECIFIGEWRELERTRNVERWFSDRFMNGICFPNTCTSRTVEKFPDVVQNSDVRVVWRNDSNVGCEDTVKFFDLLRGIHEDSSRNRDVTTMESLIVISRELH